jgi:hypothetical protein
MTAATEVVGVVSGGCRASCDRPCVANRSVAPPAPERGERTEAAAAATAAVGLSIVTVVDATSGGVRAPPPVAIDRACDEKAAGGATDPPVPADSPYEVVVRTHPFCTYRDVRSGRGRCGSRAVALPLLWWSVGTGATTDPPLPTRP